MYLMTQHGVYGSKKPTKNATQLALRPNFRATVSPIYQVNIRYIIGSVDKVGLLCISRLFGLLQRCTRGLFKVYKPVQITVLLAILLGLVVDNLSPEISGKGSYRLVWIAFGRLLLLEFLENP